MTELNLKKLNLSIKVVLPIC